jgi:arginyl-tRNA synthetase
LLLEIQQKIQARFVEAVGHTFQMGVAPPALDTPPNLAMGDISLAACFELAKQLRQPPRKIAEQLIPRLSGIEGVERVTVAGAGYLNFHLQRASTAAQLFELRSASVAMPTTRRGKILVEHTSINPNKAAHIGHLRNAVLGDTFVRLLRFHGETVEIENYIDNTGVQVADVVVGFLHLEKKTRGEVEALIADPAVRFDYYCWDLYARVFQWYEEDKGALELRAQALKDIEDGRGEPAALAELISTAIVRRHLETMFRINVRYDVLVQESEILKLDFWKSAFELLKQKGAVRFEENGKNAGCWVMDLGEAASEGESAPEDADDIKIIVRSNGTVTYVGKDIAYHLWKFALLGKDFGYTAFYRYPDGHEVWRTAVHGQADAPAFGHARAAYAVIDTRQSYLQNIVKAAFYTLGYHEQAANLHHFAYEVVGLTPRCAEEMGIALSLDDLERSYVEVSGRKGQGVKADDLIDMLIARASQEVRSRNLTQDPAEQQVCARQIAVGALRYFLLKYSRRVIIAFDFKEALAFEGETGPYLQYSVVRARNIFRKFQEAQPEFQPERLAHLLAADQLQNLYTGEDGLAFWELTLLAGQLEAAVEQAISSEEPAVVAKYAFRLAQAFSNFYHRYHILGESDQARQHFLLYLVHLTERTLTLATEQMGIEIPERM